MIATKTNNNSLWKQLALLWTLLQTNGKCNVWGFSIAKSRAIGLRNYNHILKTDYLHHHHRSQTKFQKCLYLSSGDGDYVDENIDNINDNDNNNDNNDNDKDQNNNNNASTNDKKEDNLLERVMAKAQARADQKQLNDSLTSPELKDFDREIELKKVVGGISPGLSYESPDALLDLENYKLESKLAQAIQKGDFQLASQTRQLLDRLHIDDCGNVLQINSAFYQAFTEKNFEKMKVLWLDNDTVQCMHPANPPVAGYLTVLETWKQMFKAAENEFDPTGFRINTVKPTNIRLSVKGATAWITCDEEVYIPKFVRGVGKKYELIARMMTTNLFRKVDGKWYIVHHHANMYSDNPQSITNTKKTNDDINNNNPLSVLNSKIVVRGMDGPILGKDSKLENRYGEKPNPNNNNGKGPKKKTIFMGNISDVMNTSLSELLSGSSDDDIDADNNDDKNSNGSEDEDNILSDIIDSGSIGGLGRIIKNMDGKGKTVIRIRAEGKPPGDAVPATLGGNDDKDEDDDEIDEEDDQIDAEIDNPQAKIVPKDALRQDCIIALRRLAKQGSISPKQKRILLTDIITCSAKGEFSMVEVAYELLCGEGDDKDAADEEFADQCRVFADDHKSRDYPPYQS